MQFTGVALIGSVLGIAISQPLIPVIMKVFEPMIALVWDMNFDVGTALIALIFILATVFLISFISSRRINKLHPLIALRGGITTHSFRKNSLPLDKTRGSLNLLLALKYLLQKKGQTTAIIIIVAAVTMASVACIPVSYNFSEEREHFARSVFGEMPDINFILKNSEDAGAFVEKMREHPDVRKIFGFDPMMTATVKSMGIVKMDLPMPADRTILVCVALVILSYIVSMLIAWRIRKISAYSLVSE